MKLLCFFWNCAETEGVINIWQGGYVLAFYSRGKVSGWIFRCSTAQSQETVQLISSKILLPLDQNCYFYWFPVSMLSLASWSLAAALCFMNTHLLQLWTYLYSFKNSSEVYFIFLGSDKQLWQRQLAPKLSSRQQMMSHFIL